MIAFSEQDGSCCVDMNFKISDARGVPTPVFQFNEIPLNLEKTSIAEILTRYISTYGFCFRQNNAVAQVIESATGVADKYDLYVSRDFCGIVYSSSATYTIYSDGSSMNFNFKLLTPCGYYASQLSRSVGTLPTTFYIFDNHLVEYYEERPYLGFLNADVLVLQDSTLLAAYNPRVGSLGLAFWPTTKKGAIAYVCNKELRFKNLKDIGENRGIVFTSNVRTQASDFVNRIRRGLKLSVPSWAKSYEKPANTILSTAAVPVFLRLFNGVQPSEDKGYKQGSRIFFEGSSIDTVGVTEFLSDFTNPWLYAKYFETQEAYVTDLCGEFTLLYYEYINEAFNGIVDSIKIGINDANNKLALKMQDSDIGAFRQSWGDKLTPVKGRLPFSTIITPFKTSVSHDSSKILIEDQSRLSGVLQYTQINDDGEHIPVLASDIKGPGKFVCAPSFESQIDKKIADIKDAVLFDIKDTLDFKQNKLIATGIDFESLGANGPHTLNWKVLWKKGVLWRKKRLSSSSLIMRPGTGYLYCTSTRRDEEIQKLMSFKKCVLENVKILPNEGKVTGKLVFTVDMALLQSCLYPYSGEVEAKTNYTKILGTLFPSSEGYFIRYMNAFNLSVPKSSGWIRKGLATWSWSDNWGPEGPGYIAVPGLRFEVINTNYTITNSNINDSFIDNDLVSPLTGYLDGAVSQATNAAYTTAAGWLVDQLKDYGDLENLVLYGKVNGLSVLPSKICPLLTNFDVNLEELKTVVDQMKQSNAPNGQPMLIDPDLRKKLDQALRIFEDYQLSSNERRPYLYTTAEIIRAGSILDANTLGLYCSL